MRRINFAKALFLMWMCILLTYGHVNAQTVNRTSVSSAHPVRQDSIRLNKIDSVTEDISRQLRTLQDKTLAINETVKTIDEHTNDGIFVEGAKSFLLTFIYEVLGYKSDGSTGIVSKIASFVSLSLLILRVVFFINRKDKDYPKLTAAVNFYLAALVIIALLLPWTASFFPYKETDKEQILRVTENTQKLNNEIVKIQSTNFTKLRSSLEELQIRIDTLQLAKESSVKAVETKYNALQNQFVLTNKRLDTINDRILSINKEDNSAKHGQQYLQTVLIMLIFGMVSFSVYKKL